MGSFFDILKKFKVSHDARTGKIKTGVMTHLIFVSAETTGTGASQNIAHDLGVVPSRVFFCLTEHTAVAVDIAPGTHTSTNVVVTVTSGVKFVAVAIAA